MRISVLLLLGCLGCCLSYRWTAADELRSPRRLAPWVMTVIPPEPKESETFSGPRELVEIVHGMDDLDWTPNYAAKSETLREMAKEVVFRRSIWQLEFSFKPLRMTHVELPSARGARQRELVWYLVYKVKNTGYHLRPEAQEDRWGHKTFTSEAVDYPVRFFPKLVLRSAGSD